MRTRTSLWLIAIVVAARLSSAGETPSTAAGAGELFNGRDLAGWSPILADPSVPIEAVWSVRDGMIICSGSPVGVLHTSRAFKNFRLVVEYRWPPGSKPGNSGIMSRMTSSDLAVPRCVEVQLRHGSAGDLIGLRDLPVGGDPSRAIARTSPTAGKVTGVKKLIDAENPAGEWNRVEILAENDAYRVWINDRMVNEASGVEVCAGPIALQSEGGEIHFRRVSVAQLPD